MNKHISPGQAAWEFDHNCPEDTWSKQPQYTKDLWHAIAAAAIRAHLSSIGARGGGKGTPAQARAARKNGMRNRKSKGKPRPASRFADVTCEKCGCRFAVELWRGKQTVKKISTICAVCSPGSCK